MFMFIKVISQITIFHVICRYIFQNFFYAITDQKCNKKNKPNIIDNYYYFQPIHTHTHIWR